MSYKVDLIQSRDSNRYCFYSVRVRDEKGNPVSPLFKSFLFNPNPTKDDLNLYSGEYPLSEHKAFKDAVKYISTLIKDESLSNLECVRSGPLLEFTVEFL